MASFTSAQVNALYQEIENECAEYARTHGPITAAQSNEIAARVMEAARNAPTVRLVGPHGT
jgi:hypothetical protein